MYRLVGITKAAGFKRDDAGRIVARPMDFMLDCSDANELARAMGELGISDPHVSRPGGSVILMYKESTLGAMMGAGASWVDLGDGMGCIALEADLKLIGAGSYKGMLGVDVSKPMGPTGAPGWGSGDGRAGFDAHRAGYHAYVAEVASRQAASEAPAPPPVATQPVAVQPVAVESRTSQVAPTRAAGRVSPQAVRETRLVESEVADGVRFVPLVADDPMTKGPVDEEGFRDACRERLAALRSSTVTSAQRTYEALRGVRDAELRNALLYCVAASSVANEVGRENMPEGRLTAMEEGLASLRDHIDTGNVRVPASSREAVVGLVEGMSECLGNVASGRQLDASGVAHERRRVPAVVADVSTVQHEGVDVS